MAPVWSKTEEEVLVRLFGEIMNITRRNKLRMLTSFRSMNQSLTVTKVLVLESTALQSPQRIAWFRHNKAQREQVRHWWLHTTLHWPSPSGSSKTWMHPVHHGQHRCTWVRIQLACKCPHIPCQQNCYEENFLRTAFVSLGRTYSRD